MHQRNPYQDKPGLWSSHHVIASMLSDIPAGSRILDVGAASGTLARLCIEKKFEIRGIEPVSEWIEGARHLYADVYIGSLESATDEYLRGHSTVVCGDILEHLPDPEKALWRLVSLQDSGCRFIVSVPNIANGWVRLNLLFGRFDYTDRGILDRTHLRFFTRKSFLRMLKEASLEVQMLHATPVPLDLINPFFVRSSIGRHLFAFFARLTSWLPTLLGYQWIARAEKV